MQRLKERKEEAREFVGVIVNGGCPECGANLARSAKEWRRLVCTLCDRHYVMCENLAGKWYLLLIEDVCERNQFYDCIEGTNKTQ